MPTNVGISASVENPADGDATSDVRHIVPSIPDAPFPFILASVGNTLLSDE